MFDKLSNGEMCSNTLILTEWSRVYLWDQFVYLERSLKLDALREGLADPGTQTRLSRNLMTAQHNCLYVSSTLPTPNCLMCSKSTRNT
jgi:hypothetical protein